MKVLIKILIYITITFWGSSVFGQLMHPGDVNNNGVVNGVDVLYWGKANGATGPERVGATLDFLPQVVPLGWLDIFFNELSYAYADGDGDGEVDENDVDSTIVSNYGRMHGNPSSDEFNSNGNPNEDPQLALSPDMEEVEGGTTVNISVELGTNNIPISDFYGITFSLFYNPDAIDEDSINFQPNISNWIDPGEQNSKSVSQKPNPGVADVAITRTNQEGTDGFGEIGAFVIVIDDLVDALGLDSLDFQIDSVKLVDPDLNTIPVAVESLQLYISSDTMTMDTTMIDTTDMNMDTTDMDTTNMDTTVFMQQLFLDQYVEVYPNPTRNFITISSDNFYIRTIELVNTLGQPILCTISRLTPYQITVLPKGGPPGVYLLRILTDQGVLTRKIFISD